VETKGVVLPLLRTSRIVTACAALLVAAVVAGAPLAASPRERLKEKAAQAQAVLQQVNALDQQFGLTVEAWHGAQYDLAEARRQLATDRTNLRVAERQRRIAVARVRARLIALYESDDDESTISILLGSKTLSDVLSRLDAAQAISKADHNLAVETTAARNRYAAAERATLATERRRESALSALTSRRQQIESMLGERKRLLSSIQSEITQLRAEEARRQAILAAQARARLAREQAALLARQRAAAEAAARAAAARRAAPKPQAPAPPTTPAQPAQPAPTTTAAPALASAPVPEPSALSAVGHPQAATIAMQYLGVPYVWGGGSPSGFDCSGLVMYVYAQLGISLPHYAAAQFGFGEPVSRDQLQPGDLVFFDGLGHVGIYIGGGELIHAPHTGDVVKISPLSEFGASYVGARRI
jgi:cell wall-associated NlpC family hydrolase